MLREIITGVVVAGAISGCASMQEDRPLNINMAAQSGSGQGGTATLTPTGGSTSVAVKVAPGAAGVGQPAHVHEGTCAKLNPQPNYGLAPVTNGTSTTTVGASLSSLLASPHAINVHKSADDLKTYVSCGDIKR
jgi:hypothetical protein